MDYFRLLITRCEFTHMTYHSSERNFIPCTDSDFVKVLSRLGESESELKILKLEILVNDVQKQNTLLKYE